MTRIELSDGWTAGGSIDGLEAALRSFFKKHQMRVIGEQAGEMHVRQGFAWLARLLGARLAPPRWLPKRATVKLHQAGGGVAVRVSIEEASTSKALSQRLQEKYQTYFDWWMAQLKAAIR